MTFVLKSITDELMLFCFGVNNTNTRLDKLGCVWRRGESTL